LRGKNKEVRQQMNDPHPDLSNVLRAIRSDEGISVREAAKRCHIPAGTWASIEARRIRRPRPEILRKISAGFSIPVLVDSIAAEYFERDTEPESFVAVLNSETSERSPRRSATEWSQLLSSWGLQYLRTMTNRRDRRELEFLVNRWAEEKGLSLTDRELTVFASTGELPPSWPWTWLSDLPGPWVWSLLYVIHNSRVLDEDTPHSIWIDLIALFFIMRRIQRPPPACAGAKKIINAPYN